MVNYCHEMKWDLELAICTPVERNLKEIAYNSIGPNVTTEKGLSNSISLARNNFPGFGLSLYNERLSNQFVLGLSFHLISKVSYILRRQVNIGNF